MESPFKATLYFQGDSVLGGGREGAGRVAGRYKSVSRKAGQVEGIKVREGKEAGRLFPHNFLG